MVFALSELSRLFRAPSIKPVDVFLIAPIQTLFQFLTISFAETHIAEFAELEQCMYIPFGGSPLFLMVLF